MEQVEPPHLPHRYWSLVLGSSPQPGSHYPLYRTVALESSQHTKDNVKHLRT